MVTSFQKQVGGSVVCAAIVAAGVMVIDDRFGPPPLVLPFQYGAVVVHLPWLLALLLIGVGSVMEMIPWRLDVRPSPDSLRS